MHLPAFNSSLRRAFIYSGKPQKQPRYQAIRLHANLLFLLRTIDFYRICGIYNDIKYYYARLYEYKCNLIENNFMRDFANDMQVYAAGKLKRKYTGEV